MILMKAKIIVLCVLIMCSQLVVSVSCTKNGRHEISENNFIVINDQLDNGISDKQEEGNNLPEIAGIQEKVRIGTKNAPFLYYSMLPNNSFVKLSFDMTDEEISFYYQMIDAFVSTVRGPHIKVTYSGNVIFNNYYFRDTPIYYGEKNFIQYKEQNINPLKSFPGYIILEDDIVLYKQIYVDDENSNDNLLRFDGYEAADLLTSGTVIQISGISVEMDDYIIANGIQTIDRNNRTEVYSYIKPNDIELLKSLRESVSYRLIDGRLYRIIGGEQTEINFHHSDAGYYENGYKYIRNQYGHGFYFWEVIGDYLFDEEGNFVGTAESKYGPDYYEH